MTLEAQQMILRDDRQWAIRNQWNGISGRSSCFKRVLSLTDQQFLFSVPVHIVLGMALVHRTFLIDALQQWETQRVIRLNVTRLSLPLL